MTSRRPVAVALTLGLVAVTASACATTYDESEEPSTSANSTSTTLPTGTPPQLLRLLLDDARDLGTRIDEHEPTATPTLERIELVWRTVRPDLEQSHPQLVDAFDVNVERCRIAVERNRPADADKAYRNLASLVDSYAPA